MVAFITAAFIFVFCPYGALMSLDPNAAQKPTESTLLRLLFTSIVLVDPLIYIFCCEKYREEIKLLLQSIYDFSVKGMATETQSTELQISKI